MILITNPHRAWALSWLELIIQLFCLISLLTYNVLLFTENDDSPLMLNKNNNGWLWKYFISWTWTSLIFVWRQLIFVVSMKKKIATDNFARILYKVFNLFLLFSSLPSVVQANSHLEISHGRDCRCSHAEEDETLAKYTSPSHSSTRHDISVNKSKLEHLVWKKKEKSKPIPIYLAVYQENSLKCMRQFRHLCAFICRWEPKYCKVTVWKVCNVYICSFLIRRVIVLTFYRDFIIFWCRYFFDLWDVFITYPLFYYRIFRRNVDQIPESIIKVKFNCYKCWVCMFLLNQIFGDVN